MCADPRSPVAKALGHRSRHELVLTTTFDTKARRHKGQKQEKPTTIAWVIGNGSPFGCLCFSLQFAFVSICASMEARREDARRGFRPWLRSFRAAGRLRVDENTEKSPHLRGIALTKVPRRMRAGAFAPGYEGCARRALLPSPLELCITHIANGAQTGCYPQRYLLE